MAITERARHELYDRLVEVLGDDEAAILMEHLPPVGWAGVATKRDLDHVVDALRQEIRALSAETGVRFESARHGFEADLYRGLRAQTFALIAAFTALAGAVIASVRL